jgi:prepilin-type N-terminal cleavage/methylation domain-containing protein
MNKFTPKVTGKNHVTVILNFTKRSGKETSQLSLYALAKPLANQNLYDADKQDKTIGKFAKHGIKRFRVVARNEWKVENRNNQEKTDKKAAFTLAEVLITLGVIGIVAAMTIPTLITNTNSAKYRSQFKKTISTLNQAGLMAQAQYEFNYAGTTSVCSNDGAKEHPEEVFTFCSLLNGTLTGKTYFQDLADITRNNNGVADTYKVVKRYTLDGISDNKEIGRTSYHAYTLADGTIVAFKYRATECELPVGTPLTSDLMPQSGSDGASYAHLNKCVGFIDVNGASLPNKEVSCTTGTTSREVEKPCAVKNDGTHMTDIFPIVFHDSTVEPASNAAKYVLTSTK